MVGSGRKIQTLVSRTNSDGHDGIPEPLTGQYQTTGPAYFSLMNQGPTLHIVMGVWGYGEGPGEILTRMSTHGQQKSILFCNGVWGHWLPRYWQSGHARWKREYIKTLPENLLDSVENICGDRNHPFVLKVTMFRHTRCVKLLHGGSSRIYQPFNGRLSPWTLIW